MMIEIKGGETTIRFFCSVLLQQYKELFFS
jgi:hypothetical protein